MGPDASLIDSCFSRGPQTLSSPTPPKPNRWKNGCQWLPKVWQCKALKEPCVVCCLAVVPAGYYLKGPGQAVPCPKGEWKEGVGLQGNCTKCPVGVTTASEGSTSLNACQGGWVCFRVV